MNQFNPGFDQNPNQNLNRGHSKLGARRPVCNGLRFRHTLACL